MSAQKIPNADPQLLASRLKKAGLTLSAISTHTGIKEDKLKRYARGSVKIPDFDDVRALWDLGVNRLTEDELSECVKH